MQQTAIRVSGPRLATTNRVLVLVFLLHGLLPHCLVVVYRLVCFPGWCARVCGGGGGGGGGGDVSVHFCRLHTHARDI